MRAERETHFFVINHIHFECIDVYLLHFKSYWAEPKLSSHRISSSSVELNNLQNDNPTDRKKWDPQLLLLTVIKMK